MTGNSGSSGTSGAGAGANGGKDFGSHNTSSNPSAPTTDSSGLSPHAASNVGTSPNNHSNLTAACNNTNLSINVNLNNLSLRSPVGPHQLHMMAPSNHNRHPAQQGIQRPLIHQTRKKPARGLLLLSVSSHRLTFTSGPWLFSISLFSTVDYRSAWSRNVCCSYTSTPTVDKFELSIFTCIPLLNCVFFFFFLMYDPKFVTGYSNLRIPRYSNWNVLNLIEICFLVRLTKFFKCT